MKGHLISFYNITINLYPTIESGWKATKYCSTPVLTIRSLAPDSALFGFIQNIQFSDEIMNINRIKHAMNAISLNSLEDENQNIFEILIIITNCYNKIRTGEIYNA